MVKIREGQSRLLIRYFLKYEIILGYIFENKKLLKEILMSFLNYELVKLIGDTIMSLYHKVLSLYLFIFFSILTTLFLIHAGNTNTDLQKW